MATDTESPLQQLVAAELAQPTSAAARSFSELLQKRHGESVALVLFYGSCLRQATREGVLDFYVVVDSYRSAYDGLILPAINSLVPPNVFFVEHSDALGTLRAKYAVLSRRDFERLVQSDARIPYFWARFCQPTAVVYARDAEARQLAIRCCAQAIVTLVRRLSVFLPATGRVQRFSLAALWHAAFERTYASELRPESAEKVHGVYEAAPERYDVAGRLALEQLASSNWFDRVEFLGNSVELEMPPARRRKGRWRWQLERPAAKALALLRLIKNAGTFGDWLPYVLWKIERHTGTRVELTDRQRRHPLIFAWPVFVRLVLQRNLR